MKIRQLIWKQTCGKLLTGLVIGICPVIILYIHSTNFHRNKNAFYRVFPPHMIITSRTLDIGNFSSNIIGVATSNLYIRSYQNPYDILSVDMNLLDSRAIELNWAEKQKFESNQVVINIDSPDIFITDKIRSFIFRGSLHQTSLFRQINNLRFSSSEVKPMSNGSMVVRLFQDNIQNNILAKINFHNSTGIDSANVMEKQVDGYFCTDGYFDIDPVTKHVAYIYFYRNQFIYMDSNLKLMYRAKTLDTNSKSKIQVRTIHSQNLLATPPLIVNKFICISNKSVLVNSALKADNEDAGTFKDNIVMDVFEAADGRYRFSFYLPKFEKTSLASMVLKGNTLFTIQGHLIVRYELNL